MIDVTAIVGREGESGRSVRVFLIHAFVLVVFCFSTNFHCIFFDSLHNAHTAHSLAFTLLTTSPRRPLHSKNSGAEPTLSRSDILRIVFDLCQTNDINVGAGI